MADIYRISLIRSPNFTPSMTIHFWRTGNLPLAATARMFISLYGPPCRVQINNADWPVEMHLVYPKLWIAVDNINDDPYDKHDLKLDFDAFVFAVEMAESPSWTCDHSPSLADGAWQGFTTADAYLARYRRALAMTPTP